MKGNRGFVLQPAISIIRLSPSPSPSAIVTAHLILAPLYNEEMVVERANTLVQWAERMHLATPPTQDDVSSLVDGRQLDSKDAVEEWIREVEALRMVEASARDAAQ